MGRRLDRREFMRRAAATAIALPGLATLRPAGGIARVATMGALANPQPPKSFRGIFAILQTPFDENDRVDWEDLEREVNFCERAGAHGLVWPQLAGEFYLLSEEERRRGMEVIIKAAAGRAPVVIGVQAPSADIARQFARHAEEKGADAVIAIPPFLGAVGLDTAGAYYRALAQAVKLPIFIQNSGEPWGPALPTSWVIQLAKEQPQLAYIKEEVGAVSHRLAEYARSGVMSGIFSGNAGRNLLDELAHGASGTMPACQFVDIAAQIYNLASAGKTEEARALFEKLLPMINMEEIYGLHFVKTILVRRGVFKSAKLRGVSGGGLDAQDQQELEAWWKELAPHFKV
jgi:dihydrodipicolinate synthase/N-acetylneuraminate lyase